MAPSIQDGALVSDYQSTSLSGEELITVTPGNGLAPGTYFAMLAVWTEDARTEGEIRADILIGPGPDPGGARCGAEDQRSADLFFRRAAASPFYQC